MRRNVRFQPHKSVLSSRVSTQKGHLRSYRRATAHNGLVSCYLPEWSQKVLHPYKQGRIARYGAIGDISSGMRCLVTQGANVAIGDRRGKGYFPAHFGAIAAVTCLTGQLAQNGHTGRDPVPVGDSFGVVVHTPIISCVQSRTKGA